MIALALGALLSMVDVPAGSLLVVMQVRTSRGLVRVPRESLAADETTRWREERGPRCLPASALAGAAARPDGDMDIILRGGARVRAKLERRCPALDYYSGFYIRPGADAMVCADRDEIRSRAGGACGIDRFRRLVPERPRRR